MVHLFEVPTNSQLPPWMCPCSSEIFLKTFSLHQVTIPAKTELIIENPWKNIPFRNITMPYAINWDIKFIKTIYEVYTYLEIYFFVKKHYYFGWNISLANLTFNFSSPTLPHHTINILFLKHKRIMLPSEYPSPSCLRTVNNKLTNQQQQELF